MQIFFVLCYDSKILSDVFWCARKRNEISFLHFIVFLKEEIKKGKKQKIISQALKY